MTGSEFAANVIFSAGWVAVGVAAVYTRRRKAARDAEAEAGRVAEPLPLVSAAPGAPHLEAIWSSDLAALATAIENATPTPEVERELAPVAAKPKADGLQKRRRD
jgi:hypothetical protein